MSTPADPAALQNAAANVSGAAPADTQNAAPASGPAPAAGATGTPPAGDDWKAKWEASEKDKKTLAAQLAETSRKADEALKQASDPKRMLEQLVKQLGLPAEKDPKEAFVEE